MTSILVYLLLFYLVFKILYQDTEVRFVALFLGIVLFPSCVGIIDSPQVSPRHILLYSFLAVEFLKNYSDFRYALRKFPMRIPLGIVLLSFIATVLTTEGANPKAFYQLLRYILDLYGYFIAAYIIGTRIQVEDVLNRLFWPLMILGFLGIFEGMLNANYPYKIICSAFPIYDGFYPLSSSISASDSWRIRTLLTTNYPTAYGTLLCVFILFYLPHLKKLDYPKYLVVTFVLVYAANLYLCGNRTAILCCGLGFIFWISRQWHVAFKIFAIGLVAIGTTIYGYQVVAHFSQESRGSSLQLREQQLFFSVSQIIDKPLFGNGVGYMTKHVFETDQYGDRIRNDEYMGLESIVFAKLINYGFVGLFTYYLFCLWMTIWFYSKRKLHPQAATGYLLTAGATLFFTLSGNMGNASAYVYLILGLVMGNLVSLKEAQEEEEESYLLAQESTAKDIE